MNRARRTQQQHAGVVGNQPQAGELLLRAPADPTVAGPALEGARLPADQGQPLFLVFGHVAQTPTGKLSKPQIVALVHEGVPADALVGTGQAESDLSGRGGQNQIGFFHAESASDPARKGQPFFASNRLFLA